MPDRILPASRGFLDGFLYVIGFCYMGYGLSWLALLAPGKLGGIPWFHDSLTDDTVGWWFLIGGATIIILMLWRFWKSFASVLSVLIPLIPGVIFLLAWFSGYYPLGIVAAFSSILFSVISLWVILRISWDVRSESRLLKELKSEGR